ncbi:hypothetical protein [Marivivens niveibacter]|uniref:hypothetical protein n=1 Tax=Marivivens niveibacter TaxID=1930667 RepID=UPI0013FD6EDB|nr:hypothetical protein [Marivivens niveibacter]
MTDPPIRHALPIDNTMLTSHHTIKCRAAADGGFEPKVANTALCFNVVDAQ